MEQKYLTIQEAIAHSGKSEETIRRWVRHTRAQFQVELNATNPEIEEKTAILRKRNETNPDGSPRRDRHGEPVFEWLLQMSALDASFPVEEEQATPTLPADPPHSSDEDPHDDTHRRTEDPHDPPQTENEGTHKPVAEDPHDGTHKSDEDTNDPPQEEYMWMPRSTYEALLAQLETKDTQISRKDTQIEAEQERNREQNILLQGFQRQLGPPPQPIETAGSARDGEDKQDQ